MKKMITCLMASALSLSLLAACGAPAQSAPIQSPAPQPETAAPAAETSAPSAVGVVLLSVNPEIEVEYDSKGLVIEIDGRNDDGRKVIANYAGFQGKSCEEVVRELVEEICASGYFQQSVGGKTKNVVVKLEEGSAYPGDDFLEGVARGVRTAVEQYGVDSKPVTVEEKDLNDNGYIGLDKAKELVLTQLGLDEASFTEREYELDDGVYELEFTSGGVEYEFEVNAVNGKVLEADYDRNDDWDDDRPAKPVQSTQPPKSERPAENIKPSANYISLETARANALKHLGLSEDAVFADREQDLDDGKYELEFTCEGIEYEVEVNARTGEVIEIEKDRDDDRYDRDDDDDDWDDRYDDDDDDDWDD